MRKVFVCHGSKYNYNDVLLDANMDEKSTMVVWMTKKHIETWLRNKLSTDRNGQICQKNSVPNYCQSVCSKQTTLEEDRERF